MNTNYEVEKEDWEQMDVDRKLWLIFNTFNHHRDIENMRFKKLENRKAFDTTLSGFSGFLGGFIAFFFSKVLK